MLKWHRGITTPILETEPSTATKIGTLKMQFGKVLGRKAEILKERFQKAANYIHRNRDADDEEPGCSTILCNTFQKLNNGFRRGAQKLRLVGSKENASKSGDEQIPHLTLALTVSSGSSDSPPPSYQSYEASKDKNKRIWGPIPEIPKEAYVELALKYGPIGVFDEDGHFVRTTAKVTQQMNGSNNVVCIVQYDDGSKVAIKVPACGWGKKWMKADEESMRNQVNTIQYIRRKTDFPVPTVVAWDATMNSCFGAPFIIMECLEGKNVSVAWFDDNDGPLPLEQKRRNILKSVAQNINKLHELSFDKMGALYFDDVNDEPTIGPSIDVWHGMSERTNKTLKLDLDDFLEPACESSQDYFWEALEDWRDKKMEAWDAQCPGQKEHIQGIYMLFSIFLDYLPHSPLTSKPDAGPETFVLTPPDFDWQNIIVDDYGNVTGFVDWDRVQSMPKFLGWAGVPGFLAADYWEDYDWPRRDGFPALSPDELIHYRKLYSHFMEEACRGLGEGGADWKYTPKSHIFDCLTSAIGSNMAMDSLAHKILEQVAPRVQKYRFVMGLGDHGWAPGQEEWLREKIRTFFAC